MCDGSVERHGERERERESVPPSFGRKLLSLETSAGNFFLSTEQKRRRLCLVLADTSARLFRPINLYRLAGLLFYFSLFASFFSLSFLGSFFVVDWTIARVELLARGGERKERKKHSLGTRRERAKVFCFVERIASLFFDCWRRDESGREKISTSNCPTRLYGFLPLEFHCCSAAIQTDERDGQKSI